MNLIDAISRSLPGYQGPATFGAARWGQILPLYNAQRGTIGRTKATTTVPSLQSLWCHSKREMLELIDRNSGLGVPVQPPAPGPVVGHQHQHLSLQQQPVSSYPMVL
jgi:hypothetical protein